jgi:hypothetical protein
VAHVGEELRFGTACYLGRILCHNEFALGLLPCIDLANQFRVGPEQSLGAAPDRFFQALVEFFKTQLLFLEQLLRLLEGADILGGEDDGLQACRLVVHPRHG